jgi:hypothetical protein
MDKFLSVLPSKAIDPKRTGISKSTVLAASYCGRKAYWMENVRTPDGARVQTAMPERVVFGTAVDVSALALMTWHRDRLIDDSSEANLLDVATELGVSAAAERNCSEFIGWDDFRKELALSVFTLNQLLKQNRLPLEGAEFQGLSGESLRYTDPEFGELVGTPDVLARSDDGRLFIVDVKSSARAKTETDLRSAEMAFYVYLAMRAMSLTEYPDVGYLVWVRGKREPRWEMVAGPTGAEHEALGRAYLESTRSAVRSLHTTTFNTGMCASCDWRHAIAGLHEGCDVGKSVLAIKEAADEQA